MQKYEDFTTIDWIKDMTVSRQRHQSLINRSGLMGWFFMLYDKSIGWILIIIIGVLSGIASAWIDVVSEYLSDIKDGYCSDLWYLNQDFCCYEVDRADAECTAWVEWKAGFLMYPLTATLMAIISGYFVITLAPYAAGSGIPEVKTILGGFVIRKFLGAWTLLVKSVGLCLSVGSGLSLGKEGPLVHVTNAIGNIVVRLFDKYADNEAKKREVLTVASAAGVSVAFGSPIGGVLFALEEVSSYFTYKTMWRCFVCAMVSTVTLHMLNPFRTNQLVLFQVIYDRAWHSFELIWFILIGVFGGIFGAIFIRFNVRIQQWRQVSSWAKQYPVIEVAIVAFLTAGIGYFNFFSRVSNSELVLSLFRECEKDEFNGLCDQSNYLSNSLSLLYVCLLKLVLMTITFGIKVPAGIFVPSMVVGACFGRVVGIAVQSLQEAHPDWSLFSSCLLASGAESTGGHCVTPGIYALVGAAAALGGVTRMTISLVVIMFELTGASTYVLPIMIAVMTSKWVGDALNGKNSIYECIVELKGYPYLDENEEFIDDALVDDVMTPADRLYTLSGYSETLESIERLLDSTSVQGYPVIGQDSLIFGFITRSDLKYVLRTYTPQFPSSTRICFVSPEVSTNQNNLASSIQSNVMDNMTAMDQISIYSQPQQVQQQHAADQRSIASQLSSPQGQNDGKMSIHRPANAVSNERTLYVQQYVDFNPITVQVRMDLGIVLEMFIRLGLRYCLIENEGQLAGIITKKDLLRYTKQQQHEGSYINGVSGATATTRAQNLYDTDIDDDYDDPYILPVATSSKRQSINSSPPQ
ncbi:hypothetical protein MP228_011638 [Amoeboaphelidium protococcarum]|nr:hypothetical protein MP228_011638 [Amoeboaphelidium protococcarum]